LKDGVTDFDASEKIIVFYKKASLLWKKECYSSSRMVVCIPSNYQLKWEPLKNLVKMVKKYI
jgi:hypothetical protein